MSAETRIRVLSVHVANKIAAGEVVERPASVVKELVENAIDSGATQIDVGITAGGRKRVAVSDNGSGMNRDDALLSIERQATSKIRDVDDIEHIHTLGFRGEALAAIASAARFRLTTCAEAGTPGTEVTVAGGSVQDVREIGRPVGTTVEVRDLFFNIPARRKFLRTYQTEMIHVRTTFLFQALASPRIGMSLNVDGHEVHRLAAVENIADRIRDLFGAEYLDKLLPVDARMGELRISGFISRPGVSRADRDEQFIFVNLRATSSPVVQYAIREAYRAALPKDRYPSAFLYIELSPESVDVNVHPTKREVRFRRPSDVRDALVAAISSALAGGALAATPSPVASAQGFVAPATQLRIEGLPELRTFSYPRVPRPREDDPGLGFGRSGIAPAASIAASASPSARAEVHAPAPIATDTPGSPWSWCRVVGLVGGQYVLLETEDGMVAMDPKAAHERVLYERFLKDLEQQRVPQQNLLLPETVALQAQDAARVRKYLDVMKSAGFGIAEFGGDTFVVDALPAYFADAAATSLLAEVAAELEAAGPRRGQGRWREELVARGACHAAVRSRAQLKLAEIERLVVDLAGADMPYTCPRGRPTLIFTSFKELARKFGRE